METSAAAGFEFAPRVWDLFAEWSRAVYWSGPKLERFVKAGISLPMHFSQAIDREALKRFAKLEHELSLSDENLTKTILKWGGIRPSNYNSWVKGKIGPTTELVAALRRQELSRKAAYSEFAKARQNGSVRGIGPAYFTKLIFFADPRHDGYIMDSRTARSQSVLLKSPFILGNGVGFADAQPAGDIKRYGFGLVSDKNTAEIYERFCEFVEQVAERLNAIPQKAASTPISAENAELRLFGDPVWCGMVQRLSEERQSQY